MGLIDGHIVFDVGVALLFAILLIHERMRSHRIQADADAAIARWRAAFESVAQLYNVARAELYTFRQDAYEREKGGPYAAPPG